MGSGQNKVIGLKRDISFIAAMALVVGMVIGSGIFMKPSIVIAAAGNSTFALLAWVLGGIITLAAGLSTAELGAQIPKTGGLYTYLEEVYGPIWGYLFGWMQTVIYGPATIAAFGRYFATLLLPFFGITDGLLKTPVAIGAVAFLTLVNALGSKYGGLIQSVATAGKLIPIALIAIFGLIMGNSQILGMPSSVDGSLPAAGMGAAILATLWAYDGWIGVSYVAGEMRNPAKQLPKAIIIGLGIVMLAYITVNLAVLHLLAAADIVLLGKQATGTAAGILFGDFGGKLINIGILVSIFGALNGYILTNSRVPFAMAEQGQLPAARFLSQVHPRFGTPMNASLLEMFLAVVLIFFFDPDKLTDIAMFAVWLFYILAFIAVFILRKRHPERIRTYSVPGYPFVPAIAVIGSAYIIMSTVLTNTLDCVWSILLTLVGIPIYLWSRKR